MAATAPPSSPAQGPQVVKHFERRITPVPARTSAHGKRVLTFPQCRVCVTPPPPTPTSRKTTNTECELCSILVRPDDMMI
jgi:hypothetical protein